MLCFPLEGEEIVALFPSAQDLGRSGALAQLAAASPGGGSSVRGKKPRWGDASGGKKHVADGARNRAVGFGRRQNYNLHLSAE